MFPNHYHSNKKLPSFEGSNMYSLIKSTKTKYLMKYNNLKSYTANISEQHYNFVKGILNNY